MAKNQPNDLFQYDSEQVSLLWIATELTPGLPAAEGVVNISFDVPPFELIPDGLRGWIYKRNIQTSGVCQVTMSGAHPLNQFLFGEVETSKNTGIIINGPLLLEDKWNKSKILMEGALITEYPAQGRGTNISQNLWEFKFGASKIAPNLFRRNQVA